MHRSRDGGEPAGSLTVHRQEPGRWGTDAEQSGENWGSRHRDWEQPGGTRNVERGQTSQARRGNGRYQGGARAVGYACCRKSPETGLADLGPPHPGPVGEPGAPSLGLFSDSLGVRTCLPLLLSRPNATSAFFRVHPHPLLLASGPLDSATFFQKQFLKN